MSLFNGHEKQVRNVLDSTVALIIVRFVMPGIISISIGITGWFVNKVDEKLEENKNFVSAANQNVITLNSNLTTTKNELERSIHAAKGELEKSIIGIKGELNTEVQLRGLSDEELRRRIRDLERRTQP